MTHLLENKFDSELIVPGEDLQRAINEFFDHQRNIDNIRALTKDEILIFLSEDAKKLVKAVFEIDPSEYDANHNFVSSKDADPDKLVQLKNQNYTYINERGELKPKKVGPQYVTKSAYKDFVAMNQALKNETNLSLAVQSGYRSPGFQAIIFLRNVHQHGSIAEAIKWSSIPYHSQHGDLGHLAIDVMSTHFSKNDEEAGFEKTEHYAWLLGNAANYGFELSFPEDNLQGVGFEPWHWRHMAG